MLSRQRQQEPGEGGCVTQREGRVYSDFSGGCGVGPTVRGVHVWELVASRVSLACSVGWVVKGGAWLGAGRVSRRVRRAWVEVLRCAVFFWEMMRQVWAGEETPRGSGKRFILRPVLETGGVGLSRGHVGKPRGGQEAEDRSGGALKP